MFFTIFKFELLQRLKRPETYLYFLLVTLCATVAVLFIYQNMLGAVKENAPSILASTMTISYAFMLLITSLIMGMPVLRDFKHQVAGILYTKPISKWAYLGGRFLGSFVIVLLATSGLLWGIMLGEYMPWRQPDHLLPFHFWSYLQPYLYLVLPTVFFSSAVFFVSGTLSRKLLVVYTQGILFFVAYIVSVVITRDSDATFWGAMLDPFSFNTIKEVTRYWTPRERNTTLLPFAGILLYNRIFWTLLGLIALAWGYRAFSFDLINEKPKAKALEVNPLAEAHSNSSIDLPQPILLFGLKAQWQQLWLAARFHTRAILRETAFWAIVICAIAIILVNSISLGTTYGVDSLPTTYLVIEELSELSSFFFLMILLFFSGEIIWKERDHKMQLMTDAMPVSTLVDIAGKFLGLMGIYTLLLLILIGTGVLFQLSKGYVQIDLHVYGIHFLLDMLLLLGLHTILSFLVQAVCNHKFVGHLLFIVCFLSFGILQPLGLGHPLYAFNAGDLGIYSEMNGFGHFLWQYLWHKTYWLAIGLVLLMLAALFIARGPEKEWRFRWRAVQARRSHSKRTLMAASLLVAGLTGVFIFYNTNVLADFSFPDTELAFRADYEKQLKQYEYLIQPKVVKVKTAVDIFPKERSYAAQGTYWLVNKDTLAIRSIHLQEQPARQIEMDTLHLDRPARLDDQYQKFGYHIYYLEEALQPNDTLQIHFQQHFYDAGFSAQPGTQVVENGSFFKNDHFPSIGYQNRLELREHDDRKAYSLPKKLQKRPARNHPHEVRNAVPGDDGYVIEFETTLSTSISQIAIAPGQLVRKWQEKDRAYFHYRMNAPMINFYPFLSGEFLIKEERWSAKEDSPSSTIDFEIYYHPEHAANLDRMMLGLHTGMDYFTKAFGAYPYEQVRIVEFPRYVSYAQSFPGTIAYSEDLGFVLDIDEDDVDMVFFVTAHELAHQWWGLQLAAANVEGRHLLLESLAQYSALMVLKAEYGQEKVNQFLNRERERYLTGRTKEKGQEQPLTKVQSQKYIHYGKGAVNLYALQEYISEAQLNQALHAFVDDWNCFTGPKQTDRYPTSADLLVYFQEVTPDSLQYLLSDFFETITFYRSTVNPTTVEPLANHRFLVKAQLDLQKVSIDSMGKEQLLPLHDYLDIGIYDRNDSLRYLQKHWVSDGQEFEAIVDFKAERVVVDPLGRMMWLE